MAQRRGDLGRASQLLYGEIPDLEKRLASDAGRRALVNEAVTEEADRRRWCRAGPACRWTGCWKASATKLLHMEEGLRRRVVGQEEALTRGGQRGAPRARRACRTRTGRSAASCSSGPTGVGKTELTKALAEFLFDDERAMVRIDMSEFMEKHSVSRLIGAPPGYVGYDEGGVLTEAVRRRPYQVILFDEVEKAHEDVFNVLLQVLDDGRLTDGQGRTVDFKNTIIVLTSNLGSDILAAQPEGEDLGHGLQGRDGDGARAFPARVPEPAGRNRAVPPACTRATWRRSWTSSWRGSGSCWPAANRRWSSTAKPPSGWRGEGYDPVYGARPLKRVIQRSLQNVLAGYILEGTVRDGDTVHISAGPDGLLINGRLAEAA